LLKLGREIRDLRGDMAHLPGDDREAEAVLARPCGFDQRVEGENAHPPGDALDDLDMRVGERAQGVRRLGDEARQDA
jgi:hypothetical protein